jgi:hypothetical protein
MPTLHVPGDRPPRSEHHIGVILHVVAAGHLAYRHVVGRVFFKAVADDLSDQDFSAGLGHPPAGERRLHLCDIRIVELVEEVVGVAVDAVTDAIRDCSNTSQIGLEWTSADHLG